MKNNEQSSGRMCASDCETMTKAFKKPYAAAGSLIHLMLDANVLLFWHTVNEVNYYEVKKKKKKEKDRNKEFLCNVR